MKKVLFRCLFYASVIVFYWKNKCAKVLNGDVYGTQLRDVPRTRRWDVLGASPGRRSYMFFKFNSETYLTYFDRLLETL